MTAMYRVMLLSLLAICGCAAQRAPESIAAYVTVHYTVLEAETESHIETNRSKVATHTTMPASDDCWAFALQDGLYCYEATDGAPDRFVALAQTEFAAALPLTATVLGDHSRSVVNRLVFTAAVSSGATSCVSYFLRSVPKPVAEFTSEDAYGDRKFASAVACTNGVETASLPWSPSVVDYGGEDILEVWDVFDRSGTTYVLVKSLRYAGECATFDVYALRSRSLEFVARVPLWCI